MAQQTITLVPLREELRADYLALKVYDDQDTFVETPAESLADQEARAWNIDWTIECIYADDRMVGYAMHGMNRYGDAWLDRYMIDRRYQGRGYGTEALKQLLEKMKTVYPDRKHILLSVERHNEQVIQMYERFGFTMTDDMDGIYLVMMLSKS